MPLVLVRVDDRLLHGQVSLGWASLAVELVLVADDRAAEDEWEREVYQSSGPDGAEVRVQSLADTARELLGDDDGRRAMLLVRGPQSVLELIARGVVLNEVNVGGLHAGPDRVRYADDLELSEEEARAFQTLAHRGVRCFFQPLPSDPARRLQELGVHPGGEDAS